MEPTSISGDTLKTEEGQLNAVFACFGTAAQHAQHFEAALGEFLLLFNKLSNRQLTTDAFDALDQKLQKQTMGALLREFRKYVKVNNTDVERCLESALESRNFLMHHYFRERESNFGVERERMAILAELVQIGNSLEQATALVGGMRIACSRAASNDQETAATGGESLFSIEVTPR